jgi:hypothetical protein
MRRWVLAVAAALLVIGVAGTVAYQHRPGRNSGDQCAKPVSQRHGGWTCFQQP